MIPFTGNTRKCRLIYSERMQITSWLHSGGTKGNGRKGYKGVQGTFGGGRYMLTISAMLTAS